MPGAFAEFAPVSYNSLLLRENRRQKLRGMKASESQKIERSFLQAYDEYAEKILRHIYFRVSSMPLAEDLMSETFLRAWQYARQGGEVRSFKSFLYRIANNLVVDHYRRKGREPAPLEEAPEDAEAEKILPRLEAELDRAFDRAAIAGYFSILPVEYRELLIYRYIDDLSIREIHALTGKSFAAIYTGIHRALKKLRTHITHAAI